MIKDLDLRKPASKEKWLSDPAPKGAGRFSARVRPNKAALFYYRYVDSEGKRQRLNIGAYDPKGIQGFTLKQAREYSGELSKLYQSGNKNIRQYLDSQAEQKQVELELEKQKKAEEQRAASARISVNQLFKSWESNELAHRKDGGKEAQRMMNKDVLPVIGELAAEDVKKAHVLDILEAVVSRGNQRMPKVILSLIRQMYRFALERDIVEADPTLGINKSRIGGATVERDRILSTEEIKSLARKLPESGLVEASQIAVWITLATCCRIGELLSARWEHINLESKEWLLPNTKNGKSHTICLSNFAVTQFTRLLNISGSTNFAYPGKSSATHVDTKNITRQITSRQIVDESQRLAKRTANYQSLILSGGHWTPHDLRRTGASIMAMQGVLPAVIEKCLNHEEQNRMHRVYQRYQYFDEMKEAWNILGTWLSKNLPTNR